MKKWLFFCCVVILIFSSTGCLNLPEPEPEKDPLETYSLMNHSFLEDLIKYFNESAQEEAIETFKSSFDGGTATVILKVVGKVAQIAGKIKDKNDTKAFREAVLSDLTAIREQLDNLEDQVATGFNIVNAKLAESEALDTWNSMCDNHLVVIDTAWNHYLDPDGIEGLLNILDSEESLATETYQNAVNNFINSVEGVGIFNIEQALLDVRQHITGENSYTKILNQAIDYMSLENINSFKSKDVLDGLLASYLNFYMQMINYELKGTILLTEYYNYVDVDPDDVILTDDDYEPVMSDEAKRKVESFVSDIKKQLANFVNSGERLISQFNSGDIYRDYDDPDDLVRNSNYFPFIDYFIKLTYGYENVFVFRLAWSEELASYNPDELVNIDGNSYTSVDYVDLYSGLGDEEVDIDFLLKKGYEYYYPEVDENNPENLSCISIFKLYAENDSTKSFNGGIRRYVFEQIPGYSLDVYMNKAELTENFVFDYSPIFSEHIHLFAADGASTFVIDDLLSQNNPLHGFDNDPEVISFTFGAYMSKYEFLKKVDNYDLSLYDSSQTYEQQAELFYGAVTNGHYYVETSGNQHIEVNGNKETVEVTVVPVDHIPTSGVKDGDTVVMYLVYSHNDKTHHGYMYQDNHDSGKPIKFKEGMDNAIKFTMHKKYLFPSGKLYSDEKVNRMNLFLLESGDVCMHAMSEDHERRLEFYSKNYGLNNNWFFFSKY